jgi:glycosyltransferase involved in cell wall biosynthesis
VRRTRVVIDATGLGGHAGFRGVGRYVGSLLTALADRPDLAITAVVTDPRHAPPGVSSQVVHRRAPGRLAPYEHDLLLPLSLRQPHGEVAHQPAPEPARWCRLPYVQTLHDVLPVSHPGQVTREESRRWTWYARRYRAARAVVAVSQFSADEGIRHLGLDPRRLHVARSAPDPEFRVPSPTPPADPPYLLMVSEYSPRKGYPEALAVVAALAELGYPHRLIIAGRLVPWTEPTVRDLVAASGAPTSVDIVGYVHDLPSLYRGATALLVTSRYEGFGFPAVEAMASGTPVVAFDNSATTEIVGPGGVLVPDGDVPAMVAALRPILDDPRTRDEWAQAAWTRAEELSWAEAASTYEHVFRDLAS